MLLMFITVCLDFNQQKASYCWLNPQILHSLTLITLEITRILSTNHSKGFDELFREQTGGNLTTKN